jgi:two-component system copper resistance phosphate regulon response regulator CusR
MATSSRAATTTMPQTVDRTALMEAERAKVMRGSAVADGRVARLRLLLVEDDPELASVLEAGFREHGIQVTRASTMPSGRAEASRAAFDVIVLDVMLPGGSGVDLCRDLRRQGVSTPILMLTARDAIDDRVAGLEVGADDYVTKPFAFRELVARVRALARRRPALVPRVVTIADLDVDLGSRLVRRAGKTVELTAKEFALLEFFVLHRGEVVDRAAITAHVWDDNHDPFTNVLEVLVRRLRRKIDDGFEPKLIHTLRGAGYRFGE